MFFNEDMCYNKFIGTTTKTVGGLSLGVKAGDMRFPGRKEFFIGNPSRKGADIMSVQEVIALFALVAYIVIECLKLGLEWVKLWIIVGNKNAK